MSRTFKLYREFGSLNSPPVFNAFQQGILATGNKIVNSNEDVAVIWSGLWHGRMSGNQTIYHRRIRQEKPTIIIEVGNLLRNYTWRIGINNINALGEFGNSDNLDYDRPKKLSIDLKPVKQNRKSEILIAGQHELSLQWETQPPMSVWVDRIASELKKYTNRTIKFRPHPRARYGTSYQINKYSVDRPAQLPGSYDDYNFDYNYHCVINFNSGPSVQAAVNGCPVICDQSSLAYPVSDQIENIENISLLDREDWFIKLSHTEWTVEEIASGIPLRRLLPYL
jgi:hypothetical protein